MSVHNAALLRFIPHSIINFIPWQKRRRQKAHFNFSKDEKNQLFNAFLSVL